ncbi:MAG: alpha-1,2-fucosyltransferase [Flavisolibacter sp.]
MMGGLGNQLFQYAAATSLAEKFQTRLLLDISDFNVGSIRSFDLSNFQTPLYFCEKTIQLSALNKLIDKLKPLHKRNYYKEPFFHFDTAFNHLGPDVYLKGYFQSEKYFQSITQKLQKSLKLNAQAIKNIPPYTPLFSGPDSVGVHIRKGDYAKSEIADYHGVLGIDYYHSGHQVMKKNYPNCKFYVFSEDLHWAKKNFPFSDTIFVSQNLTLSPIEDFYLMSQCKHNIIANSSFSWWAAWLNNNPSKVVIAPKKWFNNGPKDTQDLIPQEWITI